ncbi:MAG: hypothetical protein GY718_04625, partial [Lentisphaerae bacterium]|nr:hypothetical protein [Lentisphaerota bacterium]
MEDNKLSKFERLLLINQFMILKEINDIKEHLKIKENQKQDDQIEYLANIGLEDKIIPLIKGFPKCINDIFVDIDDFVSKKKIEFIHKVLS